MSHLLYLAVLLGCLTASAPLEFVLDTQLHKQWPRVLATVLPVAAVFSAWDIYAISQSQWSYNRHWTTGVALPGRLPVEELLFFIVIPICSILTLEAVRRRRPGWKIGDER